jgi:Uncharacterised nucleotidyltransferase
LHFQPPPRMAFSRQKSAIFSALSFPPDFSALPSLGKLGPSSRSKFLTWMDQGNLSLYLLHQLERQAAEDRLPREFRVALAERLALNRLRTDEWLRDFHAISSTLSDHDVPHVAMKGFTMVPEFCPSFELRHQGDIDLLVRPDDLGRTQSALVGIGYTSRGMDPSNAFHLSGPGDERVSMNESVYRSGRVRNVELHIDLREGLGPVQLDYPGGQWQRAGKRNPPDTYLTLSRADMFVYQLFHAFKHAINSWIRPGWLYEIAYFIDLNRADAALWQEVINGSGDQPLLRNALGLVLDLVRRIFRVSIPEPLRSSMLDPLPSRIPLWNQHFGRSFVQSDFPGNKLYLFAQQQFIADPQTWRSHLRTSLFPFHKKPPFSEVRHAGEPQSFADRWNKLVFLQSRLTYHARTLATYPYHSLRWRLLQRFATRS